MDNEVGLVALDEIEWNGEGILQCDGHIDLYRFRRSVAHHNGVSFEDVAARRCHIRSVGELNGYDEWWEDCGSGEDGAKAVTQEVV